ncbi:MAG: CDP-glycerol glycerophosphotransferase family protein [Acutalibacteraceae bacterium]
MSNNKIDFISCHGRGFNTDLKIVKEYLFEKDSELKFSYYIGKDTVKNPYVSSGIRRGRTEFNKSVSNVVCMDGSLPVKAKKNLKDTNRILLSVPFDYQFKVGYTLLKNGKFKEKATFKNFSYIFPGSKFGEDVLTNAYEIEGEFIKNVDLPFNWDLNYGNKKEEFKSKFEFYFPQIKNKKVMSIITTNSENHKTNLKFDLKAFLDRFSDEWFVFTNNWYIISEAAKLNSEYSNCFGYVNNFIPVQWLLYFSDCLITNVGRYATVFSATGKPTYCLNHIRNYFEKYVRVAFPKMYLESLDGFDNNFIKNHDEINELKRFIDYFSYDSSANPCEKIYEIINNKTSTQN